MAEDPKRADGADLGDLFKPISVDERWRERAVAPSRHGSAAPPMLPGQLYGMGYSLPAGLTPPPPLRPFGEAPAAEGPAVEEKAVPPELPPYLSKQPSLAPWRAQPPAPEVHRIATTFPLAAVTDEARQTDAPYPPASADASPSLADDRRRRAIDDPPVPADAPPFPADKAAGEPPAPESARPSLGAKPADGAEPSPRATGRRRYVGPSLQPPAIPDECRFPPPQEPDCAIDHPVADAPACSAHSVETPDFSEPLQPDFTAAPYPPVEPAYVAPLPPMPELPAFQPYFPVRDEIDAFFDEPSAGAATEPRDAAYEAADGATPSPGGSYDAFPYELESLPQSAELKAAGEDGFFGFAPDDPAYEKESLPQSAELEPDGSDLTAQAYYPFEGLAARPEPEGPLPFPEAPMADPWQTAPDYTQADTQPAPVYVPGRETGPEQASERSGERLPDASGAADGSAKASKATKPGKAQPAKAPKKAAAPKPPIRWSRVFALAAAAAMLLFVGVVGGNIVYRLATNEQEMKETLTAYRQRQGTDLRDDAVRVELPPAGQTFAPLPVTATPAPVITPVPTPVFAVADPAADSLNKQEAGTVQPAGSPSATPEARTRLTRYPDNTLRNVLDSMVSLYTEYPDVVGKLTIPGVVDEVVVQRNNTYYLTRNHRGAIVEGGAVFMDESCSIKTPPENLLLRAQGSVTGKTFAPLWRYQSGGEAFVASATTATLTTLYEEARYVLLAVIVADSDPSSPDYFNFASHPTFSTDEQMLAYVESAREHSLYRFSTSIRPEDRLLTLATVSSGSDTRCLVLLFRMLRNGEGLR